MRYDDKSMTYKGYVVTWKVTYGIVSDVFVFVDGNSCKLNVPFSDVEQAYCYVVGYIDHMLETKGCTDGN